MVAFLAPLLGIAGAVASSAISANAQKKANQQSIAASQAAQNLSFEQTMYLQNLAFEQNKQLSAIAHEQNKDIYHYTTPDLALIRDRALAAGFNPLTVLGSGYASGQAGSASGGGVSGGQIAPVVPQLSSQSFLADAVRDSTDIFVREVNAQREYERRQIERREDYERELELNKSFNVPQGTSGYSLSHVTPPKTVGVDDPPPREKYNENIDVWNDFTNTWYTRPNPDLVDAGPQEIASSMAMNYSLNAAQNVVLPALAPSATKRPGGRGATGATLKSGPGRYGPGSRHWRAVRGE